MNFKNKLLLKYLRRCPISFGKSFIRKKIQLQKNGDYVNYISPDGIKYKLDLNDHVMRQIYLNGIYEVNTIRHLMNLIRPNMTFIDVGANIGAYTLPISSQLPNGEVIAFEPNPTSFELLKQNAYLNNYNNIKFEKLGLSDKKEEAVLYTSSLTTASILKKGDDKISQKIKLTTLDEYCLSHNIDKIDMLKIDIEGYELNCLKGATRIIEKSDNLILVLEIDDNCFKAGISKNELFKFVSNKGFKGYYPKPYPFGMKQVKNIKEDYTDNIIFIKE